MITLVQVVSAIGAIEWGLFALTGTGLVKFSYFQKEGWRKIPALFSLFCLHEKGKKCYEDECIFTFFLLLFVTSLNWR